MTEYKEKCLALRRRRDEIERERARRAEEMANCVKMIVAMILMAAMTAAVYFIVVSYNRRIEEETRMENAIHKVTEMRREAAEVLRERPHDQLAALGYAIGTVLLAGATKEG